MQIWGDEFIIIFYDCPEKQAVEKMNRLRKEIEKHEFIYEEEIIRITSPA